MKTRALICLGLTVTLGATRTQTNAGSIAWFGTGAGADPGLISRLEDAGHTVTEFSPSSTDGAAQVAMAESNHLVIISESVSSVDVSTGAGGTFHLQDVATPVISFEAFMFDEAKWTGSTAFVDFGNSGRPEVPAELQASQDSLYVTALDHPAAGDFSAGPVQVLTQPFSVNFGKVGPEADVIATADAAGEYPATFIYEPDTVLADGSTTPGMRMGLFIGQGSGFGFSYLSEDGLLLFDAAVAYAIGQPTNPPGDADLSGFVNDDDLSLLLANWGADATGDPDGGWGRGEFNGVPPVDDDDLSLLLANWSGGGQVPEPTLTAAVAALGALGILRRRRR